MKLFLTFLLALGLGTAPVIKGQTFTTLYNFAGGSGGQGPLAGLAVSSDTLYGTTVQGGTNNAGTVFALNTSGSNFTILHSFAGGSGGSYPWSGVVISGNTLFGATAQFLASSGGTIYSMNLDGSGFTTLHTFPTNGGSGVVASGPVGTLVLSGSTLYGTATSGTSSGGDVVFSINTDGSGFATLHTFQVSDGATPNGLIVSGSALYGTTRAGGSSNYGTVFTINADGSGFRDIYSFTNGSDGSVPWAPLTLFGNTLYGTTTSGGTSSNGTVFAVTIGGAGFTILHTFNGSDGSSPYGGLALSGSTLYGTTQNGGTSGDGALFSVNTDGTGFVPLHNFAGTDGGDIWDGLVLSNNTLYGTANGAGSAGDGTVFALTLGSSTQTGSLQVTLAPEGAVVDGARWQVDGGTDHDSGTTILDLSVGVHTVSFTTISNWLAPSNMMVTISNNATTSITDAYVALAGAGTGALTVTIQPSNAITAGAAWQVDGGASERSGATVTNLAAGDHTVSFTVTPGWIAPSNETVTVSNSETSVVTGTYTVAPPPSDGLILQTNGYGTIRHALWPPLLVIGNAYTVTAVPSPNNLFSNWVGGTNPPYTVLSTSPAFTFAMQSNLVLEANFVTNLFMAAAGQYKGLFAVGGPREQSESGAFTLNVTANGAYSGSFVLGSQNISFAGKFNVGGAANITTKLSRTQTELLISLQLDVPDQMVTGSVSDGTTFLAHVLGNRVVFNASNPATNFTGQYTLIIPGTNSPTNGPYGVSYGTVKVDDMGRILFSGSLADGTAVSQSSVLSKDGDWPLYINLYGGHGSLFGWVYLTNHMLMSAPTLSWISLGNPSPAALYRSGFADQMATLTGGLYQPNQALPTGAVTLQGGNLPATITVPPDTAYNLVLKTNLKTGVITGAFESPFNPPKTIKVGGVILQGGTNATAEGYFLGTNQSGVFMINSP